MPDDEYWMSLALEQAALAAEAGEVPVGAVIVRSGTLIAAAHNQRETAKNAVRHAEMTVIEQACTVCGGWRLEDCELYVTLEPCPMCAGAAINARLKRVVYGSAEPKTGSCHSVVNLFSLPYPYRPICVGGVLEQACTAHLSAFFAARRQQKRPVRAGVLFALEGVLWDTPPQTAVMRNGVALSSPTLLPLNQPQIIQKTSTPTMIGHSPDSQLFDGTEAMLAALQGRYELYLVSDSRTDTLEAFWQACGLRHYFSGIETTERTGRSLADNIRLVMKRHHLTHAVYVGTAESDRIAAQTAGRPFIYAAYGNGHPKSYQAIIHTPSELLNVLPSLLPTPSPTT